MLIFIETVTFLDLGAKLGLTAGEGLIVLLEIFFA